MGVMIPTKARCGGCGVGCEGTEPYFESPTSAHPQTRQCHRLNQFLSAFHWNVESGCFDIDSRREVLESAEGDIV